MFKIGDNVRRKNKAIVGKEGVVTSIGEFTFGQQYLRFDGDVFGYPASWYELVPITYGPLDVTKPCQFEGGHSVTFIGKTANGRLVFEGDLVFMREADGTAAFDKTATRVINTPPPPVWPQTRWYIQFVTPQGQGHVHSKVSSSLAVAEAKAEKLRKNNRDVVIKEVIFDGKA